MSSKTSTFAWWQHYDHNMCTKNETLYTRHTTLPLQFLNLPLSHSRGSAVSKKLQETIKRRRSNHSTGWCVTRRSPQIPAAAKFDRNRRFGRGVAIKLGFDYARLDWTCQRHQPATACGDWMFNNHRFSGSK